VSDKGKRRGLEPGAGASWGAVMRGGKRCGD
jgi:hypothetical protein